LRVADEDDAVAAATRGDESDFDDIGNDGDGLSLREQVLGDFVGGNCHDFLQHLIGITNGLVGVGVREARQKGCENDEGESDFSMHGAHGEGLFDDVAGGGGRNLPGEL